MIVSKLISKCFQLPDLRVLVLSSFWVGLGAGILGTKGDSFVLWGAVSVGGDSEVVGEAEPHHAYLEAEGTGENGDDNLVGTFDSYFVDELIVDILSIFIVIVVDLFHL